MMRAMHILLRNAHPCSAMRTLPRNAHLVTFGYSVAGLRPACKSASKNPEESKLSPGSWILIWRIATFFCAKKSTDPDELTSKPILHSASPGARTLDTLIKSQVLYQLS